MQAKLSSVPGREAVRERTRGWSSDELRLLMSNSELMSDSLLERCAFGVGVLFLAPGSLSSLPLERF